VPDPISRDVLRVKLAESITQPPRALTRRDIRLPRIAGKPLAIIGVRRGGKTSFLQQQRAARIAEGRPPESQLLLGLEDERLVGMTATDLGWMIAEHEREFPTLRQNRLLTVYLDEVQLVDGWESLVHRLAETREIELFVSGSSAKLLSREVATASRGRILEVLVHPFGFREVLRHAGQEPTVPWPQISRAERAALDRALRDYLQVGGFPEAQGVEVRDRAKLLTGYVDTMVLRDVVERHNVTNITALRALQRHLLANPAGRFTVQKFYDSLRSQGVQVGKDTLHDYLAHLQDAFLVRVLDMRSASERQRMVNPRKAYPIDPGLIPLWERPGREQRGRALETAVLLELERREYSVTWLRVGDDLEVDFFATRPGDPPLLVQVSMDTTENATWDREVRALEAAAREYPDADALLITQDATPPLRALPDPLQWMSATQWLLG
jgi:predicted AAA+ superfamily ATPase